MSHPERRVPARITLILALLTMFGPFTTDTLFPALHTMGRDFGADPAAMQQVTSVYLFAYAVMSLFHGSISDAVGRKPVIIVSVALFVLASIGGALSPNLPVLLFFRALQGLFAGGGTIVARAIIPDLLTGPAAQRLMGQVQMIFGLAPAIAPIAGGWLLAAGSWPVVFWFLAGYGVLCILGTLTLPESHPPERRQPLHPTRILRGLASVLTDLRFLRMALAGAISFGALFCYIGGAPLFMVDLLGKGERDFWILFVPLIVGMISASWLSGRLAAYWPRERTVTVGLGVAVVGALVGLGQAYAGLPPLPWAVVAPAIMGFGLMLQLPAIQLLMMDMFPERRGAVASAAGFLQVMLPALITGLLTPVISGSLRQFTTGSLTVLVVGVTLWCWHLASTAGSTRR